MSWPADGLPRFVVTEISGARIGAEAIGRGTTTSTDVMLLDRANCHRVVHTWKPDAGPLPLRRYRAALRASRLERMLAA